MRLQNSTQVDGFAGIFTTTVWQDSAVHAAFVRDLVMRPLITISGLIASLALIVWFGVRLGLRSLLDLERAIERRSSDELSPIQRAVPAEVDGIVQTLNRLFSQVSRSMTAQAEFISNAAHQLRNPNAGVLSLAEAVQSAPDVQEARRRSADLLAAAQETADLSQKLLLLERAKSISPSSTHRFVDLDEAIAEWVKTMRPNAGSGGEINLDIRGKLGDLRCDPTMMREAVKNLLDNALRHGGSDLTAISISAERPLWANFYNRFNMSWAHIGCDDRVGLANGPQPAAYTIHDELFHNLSRAEVAAASEGLAAKIRVDSGTVIGTLFQYGALTPLRDLVILAKRSDPFDRGDYEWSKPGDGFEVGFWDNARFSDWVKSQRWPEVAAEGLAPEGLTLVREGRFHGVEIDAMDTPRITQDFYRKAKELAQRKVALEGRGFSATTCRDVFLELALE